MQGLEKIDHCCRDLGSLCQGFHDSNQSIAETGLAQIAKPGPHPYRRAGVEAGGNDQLVEGIIFGFPVKHAGDRGFNQIGPSKQAVTFFFGP